MQENDNTRYEIATVADFRKVPASRRTAMIADFAEFLEVADMAEEMARNLDLPEGCRIAFLDKFTWIDDGKPGISAVTVSIHTGDAR